MGAINSAKRFFFVLVAVVSLMSGAAKTSSAQVQFLVSASGARPIRAEGLTEATGSIVLSAQSSGTIKVTSTITLGYGASVAPGTGTVSTSCTGGSITKTWSGSILSLTFSTGDMNCTVGQSISVSGVRVNANAVGPGTNVSVSVTSSVPPAFQPTNPIVLIQFTALTVAVVQNVLPLAFQNTPLSINPSAPAIPTPPGEPNTVSGNPDPSPTAANSLRINLPENFSQAFLSAASEAGLEGSALNGTRFRVLLTDIPSGISVYAPRAVTSFTAGTAATTGSVDPNAFDAIALIRVGTVDNPVNADGSRGALNPVVLNQFDRMPVIGGTTTIVYEVTTDSPFQIETIRFFIALTGAAPTGTGIISGSVGFAPVGPTTIVLALPQFVAASTQVVALVEVTNQPPVANAGADQTGVANVSLTFNGSASSDPDGSIVSYQWNFGDGSPTAIGATVNHAYSTAGTYTATLTVTDNGGATASDTALVTIIQTPAQAIQSLANGVQALGLPQGTQQSLVAKLRAAIAASSRNDRVAKLAGVNQLQAFIREIKALQGLRLTPQQAANLIAAAQQIIQSLTSLP